MCPEKEGIGREEDIDDEILDDATSQNLSENEADSLEECVLPKF